MSGYLFCLRIDQFSTRIELRTKWMKDHSNNVDIVPLSIENKDDDAMTLLRASINRDAQQRQPSFLRRRCYRVAIQ